MASVRLYYVGMQRRVTRVYAVRHYTSIKKYDLRNEMTYKKIKSPKIQIFETDSGIYKHGEVPACLRVNEICSGADSPNPPRIPQILRHRFPFATYLSRRLQ